jgi:hypothetical protein
VCVLACFFKGNFELPPQNLMETFFGIKWASYFWVMFTLTLFNALVRIELSTRSWLPRGL